MCEQPHDILQTSCTYATCAVWQRDTRSSNSPALTFSRMADLTWKNFNFFTNIRKNLHVWPSRPSWFPCVECSLQCGPDMSMSGTAVGQGLRCLLQWRVRLRSLARLKQAFCRSEGWCQVPNQVPCPGQKQAKQAIIQSRLLHIHVYH